MKPERKVHLIAISVCASLLTCGQTVFRSETERKDVENVLNAVINSEPFRREYGSGQVHFAANELLTTDSALILMRDGLRVEIVDSNILQARKVKHAWLGDFTPDSVDRWTSVRVQIDFVPDDIVLNMELERKEREWVVSTHDIIKLKFSESSSGNSDGLGNPPADNTEGRRDNRVSRGCLR